MHPLPAAARQPATQGACNNACKPGCRFTSGWLQGAAAVTGAAMASATTPHGSEDYVLHHFMVKQSCQHPKNQHQKRSSTAGGEQHAQLVRLSLHMPSTRIVAGRRLRQAPAPHMPPGRGVRRRVPTSEVSLSRRGVTRRHQASAVLRLSIAPLLYARCRGVVSRV